jgi:murein DD-endopeptidase MepM/ murein hydrolase activator NlpD
MDRSVAAFLLGTLGLAGVILALSGTGSTQVPAPVEPSPPARREMVDTLKGGEALGELFARHGIGVEDLMRLVPLLEIDPRKVGAGQVFGFHHVGGDTLASTVVLRATPTLELRAAKADGDWQVTSRPIRWEARAVRLEGRIETSLYDAMAGAIADEALTGDDRVRLAWDLADVFAWQVDFTRDLQPNDRFALIFEREASELGERRLGRVLATELRLSGKGLTAFRFETGDGRTEFFDSAGRSLRRAFLRAPLQFRRIASGFSRSRLHPILGTWRRHQGIDYAADVGTPVQSAGDGRVVFVGWSGDYGRLVEVRHPHGITTRYAHLSAFGRGIGVGARVIQGDVIGFVGASGLASGPHLHYEFRRGDVAVDPRRGDPGPGEPVPAGLRDAFLTERNRLLRLLSGTADLASGGA